MLRGHMSNPNYELHTVAEELWSHFEFFLKDSNVPKPFAPSFSKSLLRCHLGVSALEARMLLYWQEEVANEQGSFRSLIDTSLVNAEFLKECCKLTHPYMTFAHWVATLSFFSKVPDLGEIKPQSQDIITSLILLRGENAFTPTLREFFEVLNRLQTLKQQFTKSPSKLGEMGLLKIIEVIRKVDALAKNVNPYLGLTFKKQQQEAA